MAEPFELYEALLWEPGSGYFLLDAHLQRLARSAKHFRFALDLARARARAARVRGAACRASRARCGSSSRPTARSWLEHVDVKPSTPVRVALAATPVDSGDEFLRHKTSRRGVYERALASRPDAQDVLLWNERRELTESCASNLVLEIDGRRLTPPVVVRPAARHVSVSPARAGRDRGGRAPRRRDPRARRRRVPDQLRAQVVRDPLARRPP